MAETPPTTVAPVLGYPEKFELALRYGQGPMASNASLSDSDKLLVDALSKQAQHGTCNEPRPSIFDAVARARHFAWVELGNRSKMEAMFMYVQAVEALAPDWWMWPELGLVADDSAAAASLASPCANGTATPSATSRISSARSGAGKGNHLSFPQLSCSSTCLQRLHIQPKRRHLLPKPLLAWLLFLGLTHGDYFISPDHASAPQAERAPSCL